MKSSKVSKVSEVIDSIRSEEKNNLGIQLAAMASDREIQKELYQIDEEFKVAEADESLS
jgi:hypothetical protein